MEDGIENSRGITIWCRICLIWRGQRRYYQYWHSQCCICACREHFEEKTLALIVLSDIPSSCTLNCFPRTPSWQSSNTPKDEDKRMLRKLPIVAPNKPTMSLMSSTLIVIKASAANMERTTGTWLSGWDILENPKAMKAFLRPMIDKFILWIPTTGLQLWHNRKMEDGKLEGWLNVWSKIMLKNNKCHRNQIVRNTTLLANLKMRHTEKHLCHIFLRYFTIF